MQDISINFAKFIAKTKAVKFGKFILKSGKKSDIFFDFGQIYYGKELLTVGEFFAEFIIHNSLQEVDVLFGPAYKGINIAIATSIALFKNHDIAIPFAYNRKVPKGYAEKGNFVGYNLNKAKSVLVLDDVITDGGTKYEAIDFLSQFAQVKIKAMIVGIDRQEVNENNELYLPLFVKKTGIHVFTISTKEEVLAQKPTNI
jgi:orotate phosphoribosyltransferase